MFCLKEINSAECFRKVWIFYVLTSFGKIFQAQCYFGFKHQTRPLLSTAVVPEIFCSLDFWGLEKV